VDSVIPGDSSDLPSASQQQRSGGHDSHASSDPDPGPDSEPEPETPRSPITHGPFRTLQSILSWDNDFVCSLPSLDSHLQDLSTLMSALIPLTPQHHITKIQRHILSLLWSQANDLTQGVSHEKQGPCVSTLVGMRGIGKTTGLKIFNATSKYAFPNLIEIYLTMNHHSTWTPNATDIHHECCCEGARAHWSSYLTPR
jgi:hypothetical protein